MRPDCSVRMSSVSGEHGHIFGVAHQQACLAFRKRRELGPLDGYHYVSNGHQGVVMLMCFSRQPSRGVAPHLVLRDGTRDMESAELTPGPRREKAMVSNSAAQVERGWGKG